MRFVLESFLSSKTDVPKGTATVSLIKKQMKLFKDAKLVQNKLLKMQDKISKVCYED